MAKKVAKHRTRWRASWKGQLRFGLVGFGVEAVNARSREGGDIHFHQLHDKCHSRIHYEKVCPIHGEISYDEIVSGYEYARGKYVEVEPEELNELRTEKEKALTIENFVEPDRIDSIFFDGRMYYLVPAGSDAQEPYQLLAAALEKQGRWGVGHIVMSGKDQVVVVRSKDGTLIMTMLNYPDEIRPADEVKADTTSRVSPKKLKLAEDLIKSWSDQDFDYDQFEDRYRNRLAELIQDKIEGREVVQPEETDEEPPVINLMEALKKSLAQARGTSGRRSATSRKSRTKSRSRKSRRAS